MPTPFSVDCSHCGEMLTITHRSMDVDGDVTCKVSPCEGCLEDIEQMTSDKMKEGLDNAHDS